MPRIRLLLDEDTQLLLAQALRAGGHDVVHVNELGMKGTADPDMFRHAAADRRAVFTHNVKHYMLLVTEYARLGRQHWGLLVSAQAPFGELRGRLLRFLGRHTAEEMRDGTRWLP